MIKKEQPIRSFLMDYLLLSLLLSGTYFMCCSFISFAYHFKKKLSQVK